MAAGTKVAEAYVELQANMAKFESQLRSAEVMTGKSVGKMQSKFQTLAPTMKKVGMGMAVAGGVITAALGLTVKSAMSFNKEMANIATLIPGATERVIELKTEVRSMAVEVGKSTSDLAGGAYQVISAFGDTADTVDILRISARAATAGVATTTDAINLLGAVTKGYGDTSKEAQLKVSDLAFQTVKLGVTDFPQLAASIGQVVPLTSELGISQEELFAVMATGTGVTGKASQVATQLRGAVQALMAPTTDMTKLLEDKGYASGKAMLADLGLIETLNTIKSVSEASNTPLQRYIGSIEGQTIALALTGAQADVYIEKLAAMSDAAGMTDAAFREQTEGINKVGFAFEQAKIRIGILGQEIGDKLLPMITPLIEKISGVVTAMSNWAKAHPKLSEGLIKFIAILGGVMLIGGPLLMLAPTIAKITSVIPALIGGLGAIKGAIIAMHVAIGPIGWAIEAIIAAIVLLYVAWTKNWGGIQEKTRAVVNFISKYFIKFVNFMSQKVLNPIITGFEWMANKILGVIGGMIGGMIDLISYLPNSLLKVFGTSQEEVKAFAVGVRETFQIELGRIPEIAEDALTWRTPEKTKEDLEEDFVEMGNTVEEWDKRSEASFKKWADDLLGVAKAAEETSERVKSAWEEMEEPEQKRLKAIQKMMDLGDQLGLTLGQAGVSQAKAMEVIAYASEGFLHATGETIDKWKELVKSSIEEFGPEMGLEGEKLAEALLYGTSPGGFIPGMVQGAKEGVDQLVIVFRNKLGTVAKIGSEMGQAFLLPTGFISEIREGGEGAADGLVGGLESKIGAVAAVGSKMGQAFAGEMSRGIASAMSQMTEGQRRGQMSLQEWRETSLSDIEPQWHGWEEAGWQSYKRGGLIPSYQGGGFVPEGKPILAEVDPGELIIPRPLTQAIMRLLGAPTQKTSYQRGGLVGTASKPSSMLNFTVNFQPGSNFTHFEKHEVRKFFYDDIYPLIREAKERA